MAFPTNSPLSNYTATGAQIYADEKPLGVVSAMGELHKHVEEGLELACRLEDRLGRVLLPSVPQEVGGNSPSAPRSVSPLTDEVETAAGKVGALNSRLRYVLSRLDV